MIIIDRLGAINDEIEYTSGYFRGRAIKKLS